MKNYSKMQTYMIYYRKRILKEKDFERKYKNYTYGRFAS